MGNQLPQLRNMPGRYRPQRRFPRWKKGILGGLLCFCGGYFLAVFLAAVLSYAPPVTVQKVNSFSPVAAEKVLADLRETANYPVRSWVLLVNRTFHLAFTSRTEAESTLNSLLATNFLPGPLGGQIENSGFQEEMVLLPGVKHTLPILTAAQALPVICAGKEKERAHLVQKGESLWAIARQYNLSLTELTELNPNFHHGRLRPGDALLVRRAEPLLTVVSTMRVTQEEEIPYTIVYENEPTLERGVEKIKVTGAKGRQRSTYRQTWCNGEETASVLVAQEILQTAQNEIVQRGTKVIVAARGSIGNSLFCWPLCGQITCPYGQKRGKGIHTGIDIDGRSGDPVLAAAAGQIIFAGWQGTYGNCVQVDHGRNLVTLYAHLSQINVVPGQNIARGACLGAVGSTGNSTGSHLHFEVLQQGQHTNPLRYLP